MFFFFEGDENNGVLLGREWGKSWVGGPFKKCNEFCVLFFLFGLVFICIGIYMKIRGLIC